MEWKIRPDTMRDACGGVRALLSEDGSVVFVTARSVFARPAVDGLFGERHLEVAQDVMELLRSADPTVVLAAFAAHVQQPAEEYIAKYTVEKRVRDDLQSRFRAWERRHSDVAISNLPAITWSVDLCFPRYHRDDDINTRPYGIVFRCLGQEYEYELSDDAYPPYVDTEEDLARWESLPDSSELTDAVQTAREHFRSMFRPILEGLVPDVEKALDQKGL